MDQYETNGLFDEMFLRECHIDLFCRILSPSNNETKREMSDRKGSFIEDNRSNFNGVLNRKTMNENSIKIPNSKSWMKVSVDF